MLNRLAKITGFSVSLVNSTKKVDQATRDILISQTLRQALIEAAQRAARGGLMAGGLGEISARLPGDLFAMNILDTAFPTLREQDFTVCALQAEKTLSSTAPGRHALWHRGIYAAYPAAQTILFCQPVYATLMAEQQRLPENRLMGDAFAAVGGIAACSDRREEILQAAADHHAVLVQGYGLLVWGEDAGATLSRAEIVERWCEISWKAT